MNANTFGHLPTSIRPFILLVSVTHSTRFLE